MPLPTLYARLLGSYGHQGWWPLKGRYDPVHKHKPKSSIQRFEIAVGAILTQNTNWGNVEKALESLRKAGKLKRGEIQRMRKDTLARLIRSSGYHNQKARKLKEFAKFSGVVNRENLLSLWGIGNETADSILLYAYDRPVFVIDAYTKRVLTRMGLVKKNASYEDMQEYFHHHLPADPKVFNEYHALLVQLAKNHCNVQPKCGGCPARDMCKHGKRRGK